MHMKSRLIALVTAFFLTGSLCSANSDPLVDLLVDFNEILLATAEAEDGFLTLKGLRSTTMMHIAVHDAINNIDPRYVRYIYKTNSANANLTAAVVQAAYSVAVTAYPEQPEFDRLRNNWLAKVEEGAAKSSGIELGNASAQAIANQRIDDGWDSEAEYQWHPMAPGVYAEFEKHSNTPKGFIFGAGWAQAKGFALKKADQFRVPPPPKIDSDAYTRAYNEVKTVGRFQSMTRTADQTHIALWWKDFAENSHNRLARKLVTESELSLHEAARLFALINISIYDAYISSFENKFHYNHWRPYTAIRWAENDGNPDTVADPSWDNTHRHTYAFPSYPSAHGTVCGASMRVFSKVLGADFPFVMETSLVDVAGPFSAKIAMQPPTRSFTSFAQAADQCGLSRVYLGIHFRYDSEQGVKLGTAVGDFIVSNLLLPL